MFIKVVTQKNKKELEQICQHFSTLAQEIYEKEKAQVLSELENDTQKTIYLDWWDGGSLWTWNKELRDHERAERYRHVNDHDWERAHSYILSTVSKGMG